MKDLLRFTCGMITAQMMQKEDEFLAENTSEKSRFRRGVATALMTAAIFGAGMGMGGQAHAQSQVQAQLPNALSTILSGVAAQAFPRNAGVAAGLASAVGNLGGQMATGQVNAIPIATAAAGSAAGAAVAGPRYSGVGAATGNIAGLVLGNALTSGSRKDEVMRQQGEQIQAGMRNNGGGQMTQANFVLVPPGSTPLDPPTADVLNRALQNLHAANQKLQHAASDVQAAEMVLGADGIQARSAAAAAYVHASQIALADATDFTRVLNNASSRGFDTRQAKEIAGPAVVFALDAATAQPGAQRTTALTYRR